MAAVRVLSKRLFSAQRNYSTYDRELLAAYAAVKHFRHMVEGRPFTLYTDHKPLTFAFTKKSSSDTPRQTRYLNFISQFTTDIWHVCLAQTTLWPIHSPVFRQSACQPFDYDQLRSEQQASEELRSLLSSDTALRLKLFKPVGSNRLTYCDVSIPHIPPYVPTSMRRSVFESLHNLFHPGFRETSRMVREKYVWPSMKKDCAQWARACIPCQQSQVHRHTCSPLGRFMLPSTRFAHVHTDIISPLPPAHGYAYLLTCIDRFSHWPEAIPLRDVSADTVASALSSGWISRFGAPQTITTNQGRQFESELSNKLTQFCGTQRIRTTAYNPKANRMVERMHRQLKAAIMCHRKSDWLQVLPWVLRMRATVCQDLQASVTELVYGTTLRLPSQLIAE
ncbi:hypothetical protein M514_14726 [Trichuris suis]|uniref:RNA-directed DNA polymerase n=1 Tax=Trichuris suis TaxID=68888 RepID=A0A085NTM6_9BILA|nr:hypothetical protein M514_14726 [Trichuris suis]